MADNNDLSQEEMNKLTEKMGFAVNDSPDFSVKGCVTSDGYPMIAITGRVLGVEAASLVDNVCKRLDDVFGHMIVDLSECNFFSSVALGFIFTLADQRKNLGGSLIVVSANDQIKKMVYMMGMGQLFNFVENMEEAREFIDNLPTE